MKARLIKKYAENVVRKEVRRYMAAASAGNCIMWYVRRDFSLARLQGKLSADKRYFVPSCGSYPALCVNSQVFRSAQAAKAKAESLRAMAEKRFSY